MYQSVACVAWRAFSFVSHASEALEHPLFWPMSRVFGFIALVSETLYVRDHKAAADSEAFAGECGTWWL